jgi:hypothetical protein
MEVSPSRIQRVRSHRLISNHRLGFCLGSTVLVGLLIGLVSRLARRSAGRSCTATRRDTGDRLVAKATYFRVFGAKFESMVIVLHCTA